MVAGRRKGKLPPRYIPERGQVLKKILKSILRNFSGPDGPSPAAGGKPRAKERISIPAALDEATHKNSVT